MMLNNDHQDVLFYLHLTLRKDAYNLNPHTVSQLTYCMSVKILHVNLQLRYKLNSSFTFHIISRYLLFQGFGHLLPSFEDGPMLGVIYDSCTFPQHDRTDKPSTRFTVSHMSHLIRKPVFGVFDQVRHKQACSATQTS